MERVWIFGIAMLAIAVVLYFRPRWKALPKAPKPQPVWDPPGRMNFRGPCPIHGFYSGWSTCPSCYNPRERATHQLDVAAELLGVDSGMISPDQFDDMARLYEAAIMLLDSRVVREADAALVKARELVEGACSRT